MSELISVLVPLYNHSRYIQETIHSIINQTYKEIELIIVDDGSTDTSWQKINELKTECEKRFARVVFEQQKNRGSCEALNKLLSLAQGDYVYIVASDDVVKPFAIEKLHSFLSKNVDYSLAVGDNEIIDENSKRIFWDENRNGVEEEKLAKYKTFAEFLQHGRNDVNFISDNFGNYPSLVEMNYVPNGYLIRKTIFDVIGNFTQEAPLEDYYLMLQISKYSKMKYMDEVLFSYRWHMENSVKKQEKMTEAIKKTKEFEQNLVKNTEERKFRLDVQNYLKYGKKYASKGVPFLLEFYKLKNLFLKKSCIKILGVEFVIKERKI